MSTSVIGNGMSRISSEFSSKLRQRIVSGELVSGSYLPPLRQLTKTYKLADKTIQRALKQLAQEGLVRSEPRKGYRILPQFKAPELGGPIAFIIAEGKQISGWMVHHRVRLGVFQELAARRGWSLLTVPTQGRPPTEICEQLVSVGACGAILDSVDESLLKRLNDFGLPAVLTDNLSLPGSIDEVRTNEFEGAYLAARFLAQKGHRRMAWLGPPDWTQNALERFGGAIAGACSAGLSPDSIERVKLENDALEAQTGIYLKGRRRPKAVLALWRDNALAVAQAAESQGLVLGQDLELVGWCPHEMFDAHYAALCPALAKQSATVTWRLSDVVTLTFDFLERRHRTLHCQQVRERVTMQVRQASPDDSPPRAMRGNGGSVV